MTSIHRIDLDRPSHAPAELRGLIDAALRSRNQPHALIGGYDEHDRLVCATLALAQPGRTAMIFASSPTRQRHVPLQARVIRLACDAFEPDHATLAQALIDTHDESLRQALAEAGFTDLATLCYMQRNIPSNPPPPDAPDAVRFEPWRADLADDFLHVLDASYHMTLDCPALQGKRRTEDVLAGHRGAGAFDPSWWTLMRVGDEPVGVLLLNRIAEIDCMELVYLGLAHAHRGRGYGAMLMQRCLWLCAQTGQTYLTLAVDASNTPAMTLYRRFGLHRTMRKRAMIKSLHDVK